ncbi:MAG: TetR/AcrR family transcriptional regulator [Jatrophihabitantaceae bacterium]
MAAATRRERLRTETTAEIKQAAWAELQDAGLQDLSLRGVARRLGMAPSALYRYFESRDELLTALIIEAYSALGAELERRYRRASARRTATPREVFLEVARAYRKWALSHSLEYKLIFGTSIPGYTGTEQTTEASMRSAGVLLRIMADLLRQEGLDAGSWHEDLAPEVRKRLQAWADTMDEPLPPEALRAALACYATLHGAINIEMYSHLPSKMGSEETFVAIIEHSIDAVLPR